MNEMIDNDGVGLALSIAGGAADAATGPDLLFVHGLGSAQVLWEPIIDVFQDRYRCWSLDLRGHGASEWASDNYGSQAYASDVAAALDHIDCPTIGIGHSLGGSSLVRVGPENHRNLLAVYALDSSIFPVQPGFSPAAPLFRKQLAMITEYRSDGRSVDDYEAWLGAAQYAGGGTNAEAMVPHQLRGRAESLSKLDPECIASVLNGGSPGTPPPSPELGIPLRVMAADPDLGAVFRPDNADPLRELSPHAEIETILGVGHQLMMIRGFDERVLVDLEDWLARMA